MAAKCYLSLTNDCKFIKLFINVSSSTIEKENHKILKNIEKEMAERNM